MHSRERLALRHAKRGRNADVLPPKHKTRRVLRFATGNPAGLGILATFSLPAPG